MTVLLRSISISIVLLAIVTVGFGQTDPRDDFWKDVERRKSMKKKDMKDITTKYGSQIFNSFGKSLFILHQEYVYEKKDKRYVKGNDDYYEREYGIGVATDQGVVTSEHLLQPWKHDNSLLPSKGYTPMNTSVGIRALADTMFTIKDESKYDLNAGKCLALYPINNQEISGSGFAPPDSMGLLMIFYHDAKLDSLSSKIFEIKPKWVEGIAEIDTQLMSKQMIGGVYFNLDTTQGKSAIVISAIISGKQVSEFKLVGLKGHLPIKAPEKTKKGTDPKGTSSKSEKSNSSQKEKKKSTDNK